MFQRGDACVYEQKELRKMCVYIIIYIYHDINSAHGIKIK